MYGLTVKRKEGQMNGRMADGQTDKDRSSDGFSDDAEYGMYML